MNMKRTLVSLAVAGVFSFPAFAWDSGTDVDVNTGATAIADPIVVASPTAIANPILVNAPTTNINVSPTLAPEANVNLNGFSPTSTSAVIFAPTFEASKVPPSAPIPANVAVSSPNIFSAPPTSPDMANLGGLDAFINACGASYSGAPRETAFEGTYSNGVISFHPSVSVRGEGSPGPATVSVMVPREKLVKVSCAGMMFVNAENPGTAPMLLMNDIVRAVQANFPGPDRYVVVTFPMMHGFTLGAKSGGFGISASPGMSFVPEGARRFLEAVVGISGNKGNTEYGFTAGATYFVFREDLTNGKDIDFSGMYGKTTAPVVATTETEIPANGNGVKKSGKKHVAAQK